MYLRSEISQKLRVGLFIFCLILPIALGACRPSEPIPTPTNFATLLPPEVKTTQPPAAKITAQSFLDSWKAGHFEEMYALLSESSKVETSIERLSSTLNNIMNEGAVSSIDYEIISESLNPAAAEVAYRVTYHSAILGDLSREMKMQLSLENGDWRIHWNPVIAMPELAGGQSLAFDRDQTWTGRASIFDRNGNLLAAQTEAVAIGVWPDYVDLKKSGGLLSLLSSFSRYRSDTIAGMISNAYPGEYLPIGEAPADQDPRRLEQLSSWGSVVVSRYNRRLYFDNGVAPHLVGYVSAIQQDELNKLRQNGYIADDRVGRKGIELWGEEVLMGQPGGTIYVLSPEGKPVAELGSAPSVFGQAIYTTIDRDFQREVQKALSYFNGAIVVLERDTGRVLALASSPTFDPNAFETDNYNWNTLLSEIVNDPRTPQYNRATQGQYPLGSVFKIITMAAGLESGRFTKDSTYDCQYTFDELPGVTLYDWTWEYFLEDGETKPSGTLTLPEGLIKSCNPWFYHIGSDLYNAGLTTQISEMARGFGLGSLTGVEGVEEEPGNVPDPGSPLDATNLAIGQGDLLVTPLQVARFIAAVGNGGALFKPQVIEKIVTRDGDVIRSFQAEKQAELPLLPVNLELIREAMFGVPNSKSPQGTAYRELNDLKVTISGKTGTATSPTGKPHAWFAGYSSENREDKPDIAVVVIAENAGEGSKIAAPIFRRVMELYFFSRPLKLYKWESTFDVTRSPTPLVTEERSTAQPNLNP